MLGLRLEPGQTIIRPIGHSQTECPSHDCPTALCHAAVPPFPAPHVPAVRLRGGSPAPELHGSCGRAAPDAKRRQPDRKSTRLNSSHSQISYAVFCLKKKTAESASSR